MRLSTLPSRSRPQRSLGLAAATLLAGLPAVAALGQESAQQPLPLKQVAMFSSGVGFFQRSGKIQGAATVPLSFRADQMNDILKSLVILDPSGGVQPVGYTTRDAITRRLGTAGKSLDRNSSLADLLRQFQGARLRLDATGEAVEGRLISVSRRAVPAPPGQAPVQVDVLNLHTTDGLRAVLLDSVQKIRLLDERLDKDLQQSLELLGRGLDDERRQVELRFSGNAEREIKAGYLQEMPVWKTSYRLVLDKGEKPYLQGWGIVENTTDEDWVGVQLSLISGRPISFIQDLYQPLYIPRPVVQPQIVGSPTPQLFAEAVESLARQERVVGSPAPTAPAGPRGAAASTAPPGAGGFGGAMGKSVGREMLRSSLAMGDAYFGTMATSVAPQAANNDRGDLFEYAIKQPVTLPRGQAAMVPIVSETVSGEALSIYDARASERQVLSGFRLKNSTGLHLSGGPITVFRDGAYAGDAQIESMRPGEDRLITFSVDPDLSVVKDESTARQDLMQVTCKAGVLQIVRKLRRERTYTFRNRASVDRTVLIQEALEPDFKLVEPAQAEEKTASEQRFKLVVDAGKNASLKVVTERPIQEQLALLNADQDGITVWAQNAQLSEKLRAALKELLTRRRTIADLQGALARIDAELKAIDTEQARIRQNMAQLDRNSPLYAQYVKKLTDQEAQIEDLKKQQARLRQEEAAAQKDLRSYLDGLTLE